MFNYHNKTRCPLDLLVPLVEHAARCVGVDPASPITVKFTQGRGAAIRGWAVRREPLVRGGAGYHEIRLTIPRSPIRLTHDGQRLISGDALDYALGLWRVVTHECGHVLDYQAMDRGENPHFAYYNSPSAGRAINHDARPQEIRANHYAKVAESKAHNPDGSFDDILLNLATWYEANPYCYTPHRKV